MPDGPQIQKALKRLFKLVGVSFDDELNFDLDEAVQEAEKNMSMFTDIYDIFQEEWRKMSKSKVFKIRVFYALKIIEEG